MPTATAIEWDIHTEFTDHIIRLARKGDRQRGITIDWDALSTRDGICSAALDRCAVSLRPIVNAGDYAAALHELGHIRSREARNVSSRLASECYAWQWAIGAAREWTEAMTSYMWKCIAMYIVDYGTVPHGQDGLVNATLWMARKAAGEGV